MPQKNDLPKVQLTYTAIQNMVGPRNVASIAFIFDPGWFKGDFYLIYLSQSRARANCQPAATPAVPPAT